MPYDITTFKEYIEKEAYSIFFDSLPAPDQPYYQFVEVDEDTGKILHQTDSLAYSGTLDTWEEGDTLTYEEPQFGYPVYGRVRFFRKGRKLTWHQQQIQSLADQLLAQVRDWAWAYTRTKNEWIRRMIEEGALTAGSAVFNQSIAGSDPWTDPTGNFIYDNKPFFANDLSGTGGSDNRHPLKTDPTKLYENYAALPLTYDNLLTVYNKMVQNNVDDWGRKIEVRPDILLVPTALEVTARQLVEADFAPHDDTTPSKPNPFKNVLRVVVWPELQVSDGWCLIDSKMKGIVVLENPADVDINVWIDEKERALYCDIVCKFGAYVRNWRPFFGCNYPQS